jgi:hypothetical protein
MDRSALYYLLYGVAGVGFGSVGLDSLLTGGFGLSASLLAIAGVAVVGSAVYQLTAKDTTTDETPGPLWLAALTAVLSVGGAILVFFG